VYVQIGEELEMTAQQNEQQVDGGPGGQTGAFSEQAGGYGTQQNEQQVDGGHGAQTGAFSEQATPGYETQPVLDDEPQAGGPQQNEQQVDGGHGGQTGAFSEQAAPGYGTQQNEQQVDGGHGGQTGAFSEQAGPSEQPVFREPTWTGAHGQHLFSGGSHGEQPQAPVFHGTALHPESSTPGDVPAGTHGSEPVSFAASNGGEDSYGTAVHEEPVHVSSEEPSYEDAGHAAATEDASGHDGGADAGQEVHHV
jgi:hypothetical protein